MRAGGWREPEKNGFCRRVAKVGLNRCKPAGVAPENPSAGWVVGQNSLQREARCHFASFAFLSAAGGYCLQQRIGATWQERPCYACKAAFRQLKFGAPLATLQRTARPATPVRREAVAPLTTPQTDGTACGEVLNRGPPLMRRKRAQASVPLQK